MTGGGAGVRILPVAAIDDVAVGTCWLGFEAPDGAACEPGQFFMLGPAEPSGTVFLGRPFSIGDVEGGRWRFLLRELGRGTAWLRGRREASPLRLVGPLGRPFARRPARVHRLVAGGVGLAPFLYLARRLRAERPGERIELHYGERTGSSHARLTAEEAGLFHEIQRTTDDGSVGRAGSVVDAVEPRPGEADVAWYACGPRPMLRALAGRLEAGGARGAQFSLEERMGCGFGVCQACVVPTREPPPRYRLLCVDGPILDPRAVAW